MKIIKLRNEKVKAADIINQVAGLSPARAISIDEMRKRVRILEAIEALKPDAVELFLEDADCDVLINAMNGFPWSGASRELLAVIDDVLGAKPQVVPQE